MTATGVCLVLLVAGAQPPQPPAQTPPPPATATIRGRVIAGDTGLALRRTEVRLNQVDAPSGTTTGAAARRENRTASTDADGKYEFKNLPGGKYYISAFKALYVQASSARQQGNAPSKPIELQAGEMLDRVDFTLLRGGVITGRVVDEFGEPLSGLDISLLRVQMTNGRRQLLPTSHGSTNDIGEFRVFGLEPGQYYVQAVWRRMASGDPTSPDRNGYPVTYFPGTTNEAEAQRFTVVAGQTISNLAMALSPIKTARVEGTVVDVDGRPMGNGFLEVLHEGANNNFMGRQPVQPDGTFTFASLAPGDYTFRTQATPTRQNVGMMKLTVGSEDIKDLRLVAMPLAIITGRIVVDPSLSPPNTPLSLMTTAEDQPPMPGSRRPARVADDLSFELTAMPGRNRISMTLPPGWAMRSVRVNSVEVIDDGIDVKPGEKITGVDVELTTKIAVIGGRVTNTRGEPVKDYTLLIFPTDSKRWKPSGRYLRTARPEPDGRFKVSGLPPADYYIVAIGKMEPGQWAEPDFLERIRERATSVTIMDGETKTIDLRLNSGS
jgi:protocatechuate 3,4-dioxygenase beta subunit